MSNNPLTPQELLTFIQASAQQGYTSPQFPPKYVLATDPVNPGPPALRLFDAAYITTGIIDPNRLGTGSTGAGNLYLADDGTWKAVSGGGGGGDMYKATYDVDNDGVVDSAERTEIIVRNSTGSTLTKGTIVYLSGATGNRPNAVRAQAHTEATSSKTIGIVEANIANNSDGYVATNGTLHDLDTSAFTAGDAVWLSATTAGGITSTVPAEPNHAVFIGFIARSHPTQGRIVLHIQNGYEFDELHGVLLSSPANNDLVVYETSSALWKNKSISTIFGGTPLVSVPTLAQVTTAGNTTTNAINTGLITTTTSAVGNMFVVNGANNTSLKVENDSSGRSFITIKGNLSATSAAGAYFTAEGYQEAWFNVIARAANAGNQYWRFGNIGTGGLNNIFAIQKLNDTGTAIALTALSIFSGTGNVGINTTSDAGYKLDVNGTARVSDTATIAKALNITGTVAVTGTGTTYANTFSSNINGTFSGTTIATLLVNEAGFSGTGSGIQNYAIVAGSSVFSKLTVNSQSTFTDSTAAQMRLQGYNVLTGASGNGSGTLLLTQTTSGGFLGLAATYGGGGSRISIFNQYNDGVTNSTSQVKVNIAGTDIAIFAGSGELAIGKGAALSGASLTTSTSITAASLIARGVYFNNTLVAAANNDVLVGLDINPTFTNGAFTGVNNIAVRAYGRILSIYDAPYDTTASNSNFVLQHSNGSQAGIAITGDGAMRVKAPAGSPFVIITGSVQTWFNRYGHSSIQAFSGDFGIYGLSDIQKFRIFNSTGNVLIQNGGTFTDAGYKLDVNGTARVQGAFTATLANVSTANVVYYNSSTGLMTYATAPIGAQFVIDYDYNITGTKNGANVLFTTSATFIVTTTRVFLNGQRLTRGAGYDYIETGTNQITFTNPPAPTDLIIIEYQI
jgi:hypothetical protein